MGGGLGGGVMFLVIALLWGAVLVPAWFRRREFNAAERNALRLQRTLRVLAETAEVPHEVRVEATAREALAHEKMLRSAQKRQEAERKATLAEAQAEQVRAEIRAQQMRRKQVAMRRAAKLRKPVIRRIRSLAALVGLVGIVGALVGVGMLFAGVGPTVLLWSLVAFAGGLGTLMLLAPGRVKLEPIEAEQVERPAGEPTPRAVEPTTAMSSEESSIAAHEAAQAAAKERIERARAMARARAERALAPRENQPDSMLLREVRAQAARGNAVSGTNSAPAAPAAEASAQGSSAQGNSPQVTQVPSKSASNRSTSGRAVPDVGSMGVIGDTSEGMPDLDQVLRRRRSAG